MAEGERAFRASVENLDVAICTTSTASVSTKIDPVTARTLSRERSLTSIARKRVSAGDVEQEEHRQRSV